MASALILLALAAYVLGLMTSRKHLFELGSKLDESFPILLDATRELFRAILVIVAMIVGFLFLIMALLLGTLYLGVEELGLLLLRIIKVVYNFIRKWWWVVALLLAASVFFVVALVSLGSISLGLYGLVMLLSAMIALLLLTLTLVTNFIAKAVTALVFTLSLAVFSCGQKDMIGAPHVIVTPTPYQLTIKRDVPQEPFAIIAETIARPGDGCIRILERLGVTESEAKQKLGSDRLTWCIDTSHKEGRGVYWGNDPKKWEVPRVCLNATPGSTFQPERWMIVLRVDGRSEIIVPKDSPLCAKR